MLCVWSLRSEVLFYLFTVFLLLYSLSNRHQTHGEEEKHPAGKFFLGAFVVPDHRHEAHTPDKEKQFSLHHKHVSLEGITTSYIWTSIRKCFFILREVSTPKHAWFSGFKPRIDHEFAELKWGVTNKVLMCCAVLIGFDYSPFISPLDNTDLCLLLVRSLHPGTNQSYCETGLKVIAVMN